MNIKEVLAMARPSTAMLKHMGETITLELRNLTAADAAAVKAAFPEPEAPTEVDGNGRKYLNVTSAKYRADRDDVMSRRSLAMAALMLGEPFFGAGTLDEWCKVLAGAFSEAQISSIITQGFRHEQITEADILRAREAVGPFGGTGTGAA